MPPTKPMTLIEAAEWLLVEADRALGWLDDLDFPTARADGLREAGQALRDAIERRGGTTPQQPRAAHPEPPKLTHADGGVF